MTPERFLQKLIHVIDTIKAPIIIMICIIAIIQVVASTFIGGQDKRAIFSTVATLMIIAAILFYVDKFILWLAAFVR